MKRFTTGGTRPRPAHAAPTSAHQRTGTQSDESRHDRGWAPQACRTGQPLRADDATHPDQRAGGWAATGTQRMEAANDGRIRVHQGAAGWLRASRLTKRAANRVRGAVAGAGPHDPRRVDIVGTTTRRGAAVGPSRIRVTSSNS